MICIFCDVPREEHSAPELAECQRIGAEAGGHFLLAAQFDSDY